MSTSIFPLVDWLLLYTWAKPTGLIETLTIGGISWTQTERSSQYPFNNQHISLKILERAMYHQEILFLNICRRSVWSKSCLTTNSSAYCFFHHELYLSGAFPVQILLYANCYPSHDHGRKYSGPMK